MAFYLTVMSVGTALIALVNILFGIAPSWYYALIASVFSTLLAFALDGMLALLVHYFPDRWFGVDNPRYFVSERACARYKRLGVKKWKDKVWELGGLGGFSKKHLSDPLSATYIERFIIESNKGVLTHRLGYAAGFLTMLFLPNACAFTIALPVALVNLYLNILPTIILRDNTPRLQKLLTRLQRKEQKEKEKALAAQAAEHLEG